MRYAFVLNPAARNGRAANVSAALLKALERANLDFDLLETERQGHGTELARLAAETHEVVVAVGGDGTVQEVMRGVLGSEAAMGIIPAGTGNDFALAIGMPKGLDASLDAMLHAETIAVDVGRVTWRERIADGSLAEYERAFTNCAGAGFDAAAAKATHRYKMLGGRLAYVAAVLETLWKWRKPDVEVEIWAGGYVEGDERQTAVRRLRADVGGPPHADIDSRTGAKIVETPPKSQIPSPNSDHLKSKIQSPKSNGPKSAISIPQSKHIHSGQFFLIEIDNGFSVGGGFLLTPSAQIDDGLFDVCLVKHLPTLRALQLMPKTFSGAHVGEPEVQLFQSRSIHIEATAPLPVQADGEILSTSAVSLDAEIVPGALRIRAPKLRLPPERG